MLGARRSVSTIYNALEMAKQVGLLLEADVDPLSNRFLGDPADWVGKRKELKKFVQLNEQAPQFTYRPDRVRAWLATDRPVVARVDPTRLLDGQGAPLPISNAVLRPTTHVAVVITHVDGDRFVVRTGWKRRPLALMPVDAPTEAWGLLFQDDDAPY